jgi:hypothetical protein
MPRDGSGCAWKGLHHFNASGLENTFHFLRLMTVQDRSRVRLTWLTRYVTVRHHVEIASGAPAERGTYDLPALQGVGRYGRGEAILVPRSSGALAVVAANDTE